MQQDTGRDGKLRRNTAARRYTPFEAAVVRVIFAVLEEPEPNPTIAEVAERLDLNVRTLQRRLERSGASFRSILNECRRERAFRDLGRSQPAIRDVSVRLGYSDPAHFARAFRRWTGHSPSEYRRLMLREHDGVAAHPGRKRRPS